MRTAVAFRALFESPTVAVGSSARCISVRFAPLLLSPLHGRTIGIERCNVGASRDNENAVASVRGANARRRDAVPPSVVPERGQVAENAVQSSRKESCDVFHDDVSWSKYANGCGVVAPESTAGSFLNACAFAGEADVLAGESPSDDVDRSDVDAARVLGCLGGVSVHAVEPLHFGDVADVGDIRPVLR